MLDRLLVDRAAVAPDDVLYTFLDAAGQPEAAWTWGALLTRARAIAAALVAAGASGRTVLFCAGPGAEQPAGLFGCFLAGAIAVPVYPPAHGAAVEAIAGIARASGAAWLLAPTVLGEPLARELRVPLIPVEQDGPPGVELPGARHDDTAIVLYTSGSTGAPKGAPLTHGAFATNLRTLAERCGRTSDDVICSWLPHAHVAGLYLRLLAVSLGARAVIFPASAFAARPALWLEVMSRHGCTLTAAPDFAYAIAARTPPDTDLDLSRWTFAVSGGEVVRPTTLDRFAARFAAAGFKPEAFHPYYGLTETLCSAIPQGSGPARLTTSRDGLAQGRLRAPRGDEDAVTLVGNGQPLGDDTRIVAVEPETLQQVGPGRIGELWTMGPAVASGYFGAPANELRLADGSGPWFRTGDLGLVHEGQVYVTGRLKELIIVRGKNHYPVDIEATAKLASAQVRECAAFAVRQDDDEEALGLAIEVPVGEVDGAALLRAVRRLVAERHGLVIHQAYMLPPGSLPRTATNKVSRAACRDAARGGGWDAQRVSVIRGGASPTAEALEIRQLAGPALRAELLGRLVALVRSSEAGGDLTAEHLARPVSELGLGSIDLARLAAGLRGATGVEPPFGAFFDGSSLRDVVETLATQLEGKHAPARPAAGWRDVINEVVWALPNQLPPPRSRPGRIFLTGATGFLGAWILHGLLQQGAQEVECLVRAADAPAGLARVIRALAAGPGWDEAWRHRLHVLPGDVSAPRFGCDAAGWAALADRTAVIVHNAANVHFVAPYPSLKPVNVDPVHAVVSLAVEGGETRPVHFVSTTAVFNATNRREQRLLLGTDRLVQPDYLYSGYAQSKWVAESAFKAANIAGVPLCVHRPGLIIGASQSGQAHTDDFLCRFIKGCIELGVYPEVDVELDLVAVDDVGHGIAAAALATLPRPFYVCQWTCPAPVRLPDLFAVFRRRGHALEPEPLQAWLARIRSSLPPDNALFPLHPFLLELPPDTQDTILELFDGLPLRVDASEAEAIRLAARLPAHPADAAQLDRMAAWLEASGFLPTLPIGANV